jgi:hypothetical protein
MLLQGVAFGHEDLSQDGAYPLIVVNDEDKRLLRRRMSNGSSSSSDNRESDRMFCGAHARIVD